MCTKPVLRRLGSRGAPEAATPAARLPSTGEAGMWLWGGDLAWRICVPLRNPGLGFHWSGGARPASPVSPSTGLAVPSACLIPRAPRMGTGEGSVPSPGPRQWGCAARVSPLSYVTACGCHGHGGGGPGSRIEAWRGPQGGLYLLHPHLHLWGLCVRPPEVRVPTWVQIVWASACPSVLLIQSGSCGAGQGLLELSP